MAEPERIADLKTLTRWAAEKWRDRTALIFDPSQETLSYMEVERRSRELAAQLQALGVAPGDRVAVMLRNRPEFPLIWLALARIAGVMVPVNVYYTATEVQRVLGHSGARLLVTTNDLAPALTRLEGEVDVVCLDARDLPAVDADREPDSAVTAETLLNIQYTSGTTGYPKGCMLTHNTFVRIAHLNMNSFPFLTKDDVLLTGQPFYYMDPQWNVATGLLCGAPVVILDRFHPSTFWATVRKHHVTFFYCLGVMPTMLLKTPSHPEDRKNSVRVITCGAIPVRAHRQLEERFGVPWYEIFGMTETGGDVGVGPEDHDALVGSGCMGRPFPDREVRVVDDDDRPVPRGEVGEMVMRGRGLMDGYFQNPEATAAVFRNGWLHTGDLVRMTPEGLIYYIGRKKDMIRRSGENIAANEVEDVLMQHPAVRVAACLPVPDEIRGEEVKAYIVLQPNASSQDASPDVLAAFCSERLAYFKVPRYWTYRDDLPRTPSEKVGKAQLAAELEDLRVGSYDRVEARWR